MKYPAPVWSEINLKAIAHNVREIRKTIKPAVQLMAVVKANAYGHGLVQVAQTALRHGANCLGVARVDEGIALRQAGLQVPILVLGYAVPESYPVAIHYDLTQTIYSCQGAAMLSEVAVRMGKEATVHLKIDTGMSRLGFVPGPESIRAIIQINQLPNLSLEGIYTHFAGADELDKSYAWKQWSVFEAFNDALTREGIVFTCRHAANSAAILEMPETHLDLVRTGIALYGYYPSAAVHRERVQLLPAMTVKARVAMVKEVAAGTGVSYGTTYITPKTTMLATIPMGYADGYNRLLSSKGEVLIHGQRAPVVGRVCMDQFMVDVGQIPDVAPDDEVVILGSQDQELIDADEIASKIGSISYEVLCLINSRVPRVYVDEESA